jgi:hypothetical protein
MQAATRFLIPVTATLALSACGAQAGPRDAAYPRLYHYTYEYNTATLVEDHYILLDSVAGSLRGWYYGTTDDFDSAREGYLPGFFVAGMEELRVSGDSIAFTLRPRALFAAPVPLRHRDPAEVPRDSLPGWTGPSIESMRNYTGRVTADSITLQLQPRPRVFVRAQRQTMEGLQRRPRLFARAQRQS